MHADTSAPRRLKKALLSPQSSVLSPQFRKRRRYSTGVLVWALSFGLLIEQGHLWADGLAPPHSFAPLVQRLRDTVVHISTDEVLAPRGAPLERFFRPLRGKRQFSRGTHLASGVIVSHDGYILTTSHTLPPDIPLTVTLANRHTYPAQVIGRDQPQDLAVLRIEASEPLAAAQLGDEHDLQVGEWVLAMGNPFGLGYSVTAGIISAVGRVIGHSTYDNFIQTDAAINPGNAGGPLFNVHGEVVGINTTVWRQARRIGFAVPSTLVRTIYTQLRETGMVARGYLGVTGQRMTRAIATALGMPHHEGVLIVEIESHSPAAQAGLRRGDVILKLAGELAHNPSQLGRLMAAQSIGSRIEALVWRDGKRRPLQVTVGVRPVRGMTPQQPSRQGLGLRVQDFTPRLARKLRIPLQPGIVVEAVEPAGAAARAGLQPGDVIVEVNHMPVANVAEFQQLLESPEAPLLLLVKRGQTAQYVVLPNS
ncbi:MAG: trypsin-like peptidase domain-containing protein [Candidatus Tectomicrobia bacterium]